MFNTTIYPFLKGIYFVYREKDRIMNYKKCGYDDFFNNLRCNPSKKVNDFNYSLYRLERI